jgi:hypothetical protein
MADYESACCKARSMSLSSKPSLFRNCTAWASPAELRK